VSSVATAPEIPGLTLVRLLGSGGYSDVFAYEQDVTELTVAVKVLKVNKVSDVTLRLFGAEAQTMARLAAHPFIIKVYQAAVAPDGRPYLVMQYCPPPNLADLVRQSPMRVSDALRTGIQLTSAVETAHRANILHRDIKPANVLVSEYGAPVLTDFGIAGKAEDTSDDDVGVSIPWSSPEVLNGASNGSPLSDVYSLAATLWHLLVGRSPFELPGGDNSQRALLARILNSPVPATGRGDVPAALDRLLQQAMSKDPRRRPRSAFELAQSLQTIEAEERFARTDIAVLDKQREERRAPVATGDIGEPATSLAPPRTVAAQPPAVPVQPAMPPPQQLRPTDGLVAPSPVAPDLPEYDPIAPVPVPKRRSAPPRQLLIAGGGLLTASIAVALLLLQGGGSDRAGATQRPPHTVVPDDKEPAGVPIVFGRRLSAASVVLTWDYTGKQPDDTFLWSQTKPVKREAVSVTSPTVTLRARGRVCITVTVRRPGDSLAPVSDEKCVS
jgi:serine/threonine protein kinase